jgi:hypothetical protein
VVLLRSYADDGYWADHGTLVVRDAILAVCDGLRADPGLVPAQMLAENAVGAQPGGTIAMAGAGWLYARTSSIDADHHVLLEAHDQAPPDDRSGWDEVTESPYRCDSGTVELGWMLADGGEGSLLLGRPGLYRVRASCRRERDGEGDTWRLQFWPARGIPEPPRWLARIVAAAGEQGSGWEDVFCYDVCTVLWGAQFAAADHPDGASAAQVAAARPPYLGGQSAGTRPGDPVLEPVPPTPPATGDPVRDAFEAQCHSELLADRERQQRELAEIAAQLGVPVPTTVAEMLPLLVKAGLLTADDAGGEVRYRPAARQPRVQDVLTLPAEQLAELERRDAFSGYAASAADLVAVALWTPGGNVGTVADLAERLLASPAEVRAALRYAEQEHLISIDGDPDLAAAQLTLSVQVAAGWGT